MTCRDAVVSMEDHVDGSLPPGRRQALATHLRQCAACAQTLRDVRCMRRLLLRTPFEPMPVAMKTALLDALRSRPQPDASFSAFRPHTRSQSECEPTPDAQPGPAGFAR
jgi:anti-sigma factor RsiW